MDCITASELITGAIDNELDPVSMGQLELHLLTCKQCRQEQELEQLTKAAIQRHATRVSVPASLRENILRQIAHEKPAHVSPWSSIVHYFQTPVRRTALATSFALAVILLFVSLPKHERHLHTQPNDGNIIHQTYNNFDEWVSGQNRPEFASSKPSEVKEFLATQVNFHVDVPPLSEFQLVGGACSQYGDDRIAQVVYRKKDAVIYLYETSLEGIMSDRSLSLPPQARSTLLQTGWYVENHAKNCTLLIWMKDSTVCCAMADMDKRALMAYFDVGR